MKKAIQYFLEVDVHYPEKCHELELPFLREQMKLEKVKKLVAKLNDKNWICYTHKKFKASIKSWINFENMFIEGLNLIKKLG